MSEEEMFRFRIAETEKKISALDERLQKTNEQISHIQANIAETNAYVKQIYDELHGVKNCEGTCIKTGKIWANIVVEMIRALITVSGIIAGIKLLA